jgi:hypothetical protein
MHWDDSFHHISFQSVPVIAAFYKFHPTKFYRIVWHVSRFTEALLVLAGVNVMNIASEIPVFARSVYLTWYPYWNPLASAAFRGIAYELTKVMTQKLVNLHFHIHSTSSKIVVSIVDPTLDNSYTAMKERGGDGDIETLLKSSTRLVVYLSRPMTEERRVLNEEELLNAIARSLAPDYKLVVIQSTGGGRNVEQILNTWQQYARVISKAKVFMGPHGK